MGEGAFPWEHAYRMPVRVRKMCVIRLQEILEKKNNPDKGGTVPERGQMPWEIRDKALNKTIKKSNVIPKVTHPPKK
jgi:hypothetical protein